MRADIETSLLPDEPANGLDELADRDRLGQIGFAAAFANALAQVGRQVVNSNLIRQMNFTGA